MDPRRSTYFGVVALGFIFFLGAGVEGNDRPLCSKTFYTTDFTEGVGDGHVVFTPVCDDVNSGLDGELTYTLADGAKGQFEVDLLTGAILVVGMTDAERKLAGTGELANPYTISVIVADKGTPPFSTPFTVFVNMKSTNDNTPGLDNLQSSITVSETESVGNIVSTCTPVDDDVDDSDHGTPFVRIKSGNEEGKFVLNQINCDLMLISPLDFETTPNYTLVLEAYDLDPVNPLSSIEELVIEVGDVNDFRPACVGYNILREVSEASPVATTLTTVECFDRDKGANGQLEYTISKGDPRLTIDKTSGNVSLLSPLDFEAGDIVLEVEIVVSDLGNASLSSTVTVVFKVKDADDNPPQLTQTSYDTTIFENTQIGTIILSLTATDVDSPNTELSKITYGLEEPCDPDWFLVDAQIGSVVVKAALDWETSSYVRCRAHAFSSNKFDDRTLTNISINLTDINDRAPIFDKFLFSGSISEDASIGTFVLKVEADDPDDGINGEFNLSMSTDAPFALDPDTGHVTLNGSIDYETKTTYLLIVVAKDKGFPTQSSLTYINIQIDPVNEFEPVISSGISLSVSEYTEPGTALTKMTADDDDAGVDGEVEFFLLDSNVPFLLESVTGDLRIGIGLDREVKDVYELTILVKDKSNTTIRSSSSTILVTVTDENDNAPNCSLVQPVYILPPTSIGAELTQLSCTDPDLGNTISYRIVGRNDNGIFDVDLTDGKVTLISSPVVGFYVLFVDVEDNGAPNLKVTLPVPITIEDELIFDNLPQSLQLFENTTDLSNIFTVNTSGAWDFVSTEIISGNDDKTFNLNPADGNIRLIHLLDRETKGTYVLRVRAVSRHGQLIESDLNIDVLDLNDDIPVFEETFVHIKVVETSPIPTVLKTLTATDGDEGVNSDIEYSVLSGNDEGFFNYTVNGDFKLVKTLDYETSTSFSVTIQANDKGDQPLSSTAVVLIEVVNQDEHPVIVAFSDTGIQLDLYEDVAIGTRIAKINGSDADADQEILFSIASGNSLRYFTINKENGTIYTASSLDYETTQNVSLVIQVVNSIGVSKTLTVNVSILDINDNSPKFSKQIYSADVLHTTPSDAVIGEIVVTDRDSGTNGHVSLSIESGNDNNHFRLNGFKLETVATLDSDIQNFYSLVIKATDGGMPSRSAIAVFQVKVDDKLRTPKFSPSSASFVFEETKTPGIIFDCDATLDGATEGEGGDLNYTVTDGNENRDFFVDRYTGKIDLVKALDFSSNPFYSLRIMASNPENSKLNDSFVLNITVTQVNRHSPIFTQEIYTWFRPENTISGTEIGFVVAIDKDVGEFGEIDFTLEPNANFDVNSSSGLIKTSSGFDYQVAQSYHLYIVAKDKGAPVSRSSSAIVIINIVDINDHAPTFAQSNQEVSIPESTVPPQEFYLILAKDEDTGNEGEISYSIISGDTKVFHIDASTGVIQLISPLDYEDKTKFVLIISGQDKGLPSLSGTTTLTVNVVDVNDHIPTFSFERVDLSLAFHSSPFTSVVKVTATDSDQGIKDSTINYLIKDGNTDALFSIDIDTGEIKTSREVVAGDTSFELIIIAVDQGSPPKTGTATIGIRVSSATASGPSDFAFVVDENKSKGTLVGRIPKDPLLSVTGYSIVSGNYNKDLTITKASNGDGVIRTTRPLDRESYALYQLIVSVQHSAGEKALKVRVTVSDANDNSPVAQHSSISIEMVENTPSATSLAKILATDADTGVNGNIDFAISNLNPLGKKYFSVDSSGVISVAAMIDYELFHSLTFDVVVKDGGVNPRSTTVSILVTVNDVFEVPLDDGNDLFRVERVLVLDSELFHSLTFDVIVRDGGVNPRSTTVSILVTVNDVFEVPLDGETTEDEPSTFKSAEIPDNLEDGDLVIVLTPDDFDLEVEPFETVQYTSVGTSVFSIDSGSGKVTVGLNSLLYPSSSYLQWLICTVSNGTETIARLMMLRFDTFDVETNLVAIVVSLSVEDLEQQRTTLQARLQTFFTSPNVVRVWAIKSTAASNRRRRLLMSESVALVVVVTDSTTDNVGNVDQTKTFLTQSQVLALLQADQSGNPVAGLSDALIPILQVLPYGDDSSGGTNANPAEIGFIAVIVIAAIVALLLIAGLTACLIIRYRKSRRFELGSRMSDEEHLCEESSKDPNDIDELQRRALALMRAHFNRQLPPIETEIGNRPFHSFRPPSRAVKTPMGLQRPIQMPPLATVELSTNKKEKKPKRLTKHSSKKNKSSQRKSSLSLFNDPDDVPDDRENEAAGRKKMVQSLEEEQIEKSKLFLFQQAVEKRKRVESQRRKRRMSEFVDKRYENNLRKTQKVRNAWRSPKASMVQNPDYDGQDEGGKSSPYKEDLPRPYRAQLLTSFHNYMKNNEEDPEPNRRKSVATPGGTS